jgi:hypothetical protein
MPTVAPNMPRETSVGFAGAPVSVLILIQQSELNNLNFEG